MREDIHSGDRQRREKREKQRKRASVGEFEVSFSLTLIQIFSHLFPILVCSSLLINLGLNNMDYVPNLVDY